MSSFQAGYAFVALLSLILGIGLFFIDGMLFYSIIFLSIFLILGFMKLMWGISVWAEKTSARNN